MVNEQEIQKLQERIVREFNSEVTQAFYTEHTKEGLWLSEKELIDRYFRLPSKVLDIGCGTGRTTLALRDMGYEVLGVDITPNMIENAKKIVSARGKEDIQYEVGDATNLKLGDNCFDYALFSNQGWSQIPTKIKRAKALEEVYRVLRPNGIFIFTVHPMIWFSKRLFFWAWQWFKFYLLKPFGFPTQELEFGDRFFKRENNGLKYNQSQYIHIPLVSTVENMVRDVGFEIVWSGEMAGVVSSPHFFVCKK
ncbi:MAG TPA: methyltransferase domain-containing protein [archaeon]|nr:methyltransferase domain-containing protein [archaeon]